jgi:hypothetical protein
MLLESLIVCILLGAILVFFYRQSVREFHILQVESFEKALPVIQERSPIVVYPFDAMPSLWNTADFDQRPQIYNLQMGGKTLKERLQPGGPQAPQPQTQTNAEEAEQVAEQVGLPLWTQEQILKAFKTAWYSFILSSHTEAYVGAIGLRPTFAHATLLICTEGEMSVSLLTDEADTYLPAEWRGRQIKEFTRNDTPHLEKIQYVDVVLHAGSALIIPPHWRVCAANRIISVDAKQPLSVWVEIHHPVSRLVEHVARKRVA